MTRGILGLALAAIVATAAFAHPAHAATAPEHLHGIVLMAAPNGTVVVHHEAFAGMPSMTMTFAVPAGTVLHPGDHISADVDLSSDPWRLSAIAVTGVQATPRRDRLTFLNVGDRVPDTPFVDQRGRRLTLDGLRGRPYVLTFIYTRCRDPRMCPLVSAKVERLQTLTAGRRVALVEVSLDPAYDRPPVLARYGALFHADAARWHLLTGDPRTVLDFAARFRILERSAGPDTIVHTERLAVVDRDGRITRFFDDAGWRPEAVASALP
jgi:cytochrome oxidase Cu insertion factor (SCO1/SenC/PrrC family)/Cu/Ag efflux protein CusF